MKGAHLAVVAVLAVALAGCGLPEGDYFGKMPEDLDPTHFRWCNSGEPEFVDPALATDTSSTPLVRLMFAGLGDYGLDFKGSAVPALAESWEVSDDLRTFTFHLRKDAVWSNGRPITSADFAYHVARILHPKTISRNTTPLMPLKNAERFNAGTVKMLQADAGPFEKGDIVEVVGQGGKVDEDGASSLPSSNDRVSTKDLKLRDLGAPESEAYSTVPAGTTVDIVELGGPNDSWAYVFCSCNDWIYGWVPLADLDIQPQGELGYTVRDIPPEHRPGVTLAPDPDFQPRQAVVKGKHLLTVPEVIGARTPDPHTFVLETWGPMPYLLDNMKSRIFRPTPRESVSRSPKRWTRPDSGLLVTSGPFTMTYWFERDKMEYLKSPTYFEADTVKIERFTVYNIDDQAASTNYYMQGGCDAVTPNAIPYSYLPALTGEKRGKPYKDFYLKPYLGIYYFVINTEKVTSVHLRRALNHAVDRGPLPDLLHGQEQPSSQFIPGRAISSLSDEELAICGVSRDTPGVAMFVEPELCYVPPPGLSFDPQKAKEELALAKKELGDKFPSELTIKYNIGSEGHKIVAEYLQNQLAMNLGMKVNLATQEWKTYLKDTSAGNFEIARMGWIGSVPDPESEFLLTLKCGSPYNRSRWCNEEYDRLFKLAEGTMNRRERLDILKKAEALIYEEAPVIPLYVYTQKTLQKPYVKDLAITFGGSAPLHRAWIDPNWRENPKTEPGK